MSLITSGEHALNRYFLCLLVGAERTAGNTMVSIQEFLCELLYTLHSFPPRFNFLMIELFILL